MQLASSKRVPLAFKVPGTDSASVGDLEALPRAASSVFLSDPEVSTEHISRTEGWGTYQSGLSVQGQDQREAVR